MIVVTVTNCQYANHGAIIVNASGRIDGSASFAEIFNKRTAQSAAIGANTSNNVNQADFTSMTRQEMFVLINDQLRSGKMPFNDSTAFLGMTFKISAETGQPVDMATDTTRINFVDKARLGFNQALSRNAEDAAKSLQLALEIMCRN